MTVTLAENSGFCAGVKRADELIKALISKNDGKIFTLGNLIHNRLYNERLSALGVNSIDISEVSDIIEKYKSEKINIVIRTHGIEKENEDYLRILEKENDNLKVYDLTCPYVKKIHKIVMDNTSEDTFFFLFCNKNHPEAKGILSYAEGERFAFSSLEELKKIEITKKVPILCAQTTENLLEFEEITAE